MPQGKLCPSASNLCAVWCTLQTRAAQIEIGDPFSETSRMGPLINKQQYEKVLGYIEVLLDPARCSWMERATCRLRLTRNHAARVLSVAQVHIPCANM